jgi:predicted ATPase
VWDVTGLSNPRQYHMSYEWIKRPDRPLMLPHYVDHRNLQFLYGALRGISSYSLQVDEMRRPREPDGGERLNADGSNIASVLERLVDKNERGWSPAGRIEDWLPVVTPGLEAVRTVDIAGYQALQFDQRPSKDAASWTFTAGEMSYGTLRWLGTLVALYQGSMHGGSPVTLVGLEEPESAVHPGAATAILEAMDEASLTTQVLATTHSAAMLDYEDLDIDIVRAVARVNGRTIIGPVDAASRQILDEALTTAGDLLRMRYLTTDEPTDDHPVGTPAASPA